MTSNLEAEKANIGDFGLVQPNYLLGPRIKDGRLESPNFNMTDLARSKLKSAYFDRLETIGGILHQTQNEILDHDKNYGYEDADDRIKTRDLVLKIFPDLRSVVELGNEEEFFNGYKLETYINTVALPNALKTRDWIIGKLPPRLHQTLELIEEVANAESVMDLIRIDRGKTVMIEPRRDEPQNEIYNSQIHRQTRILLGMTFLTAVADLSRHKDEELLLRKFSDQTSSLLYNLDTMELLVHQSLDGDTDQIAIIKNDTDVLFQAQSSSRNHFQIRRNLTVRRFGPEPDQVVIVESREKGVESQAVKSMLGRRNRDSLGMRFVLADMKYKERFIKILQENLPDWTIEMEKYDQPNPASTDSNGVKYFAWQNGTHNPKIEIQVECLRYNMHSIGSWIRKRFDHGTILNYNAYKLKQMIEGGVLESVFPYEVHGIDWSDGAVQREIYDYANKQAVQ